MKKIASAALILFTSLILNGCANSPQPDTVTQISTIDALLAGVYDGHTACSELLQYGDTGIGTFDKLDGEMVISEGVIYQVRADGNVYRSTPDQQTPFASVTDFKADRSLEVSAQTNMPQFLDSITKLSNSPNSFYAVKAHGTFSYMKTRSVPAQQKPYPPLVEAAKSQSIFEMQNVSGTIVGFYCPPYVKGINVTGFHLHFLTDDKKRGGHILDFTMQNGKAEIDLCSRFVMLLPEDQSAFQQVDLSADRTEELEQVEK